MDNILEIRNLRKEFKGFALDNISFRVPRGTIMGFIGPNGAGKTTTIKLIMGLLHSDGGEIELFGLDAFRHAKEVKEKIGFVYDEIFYFEWLNASEIGFLMPHFYLAWDRVAFAQYLARFELPARKQIKTFSRGMKMKFSLAVALSHNAELIVMDEPTAGLDPVFRQEVLEILLNVIQDESKAVLFSSHIIADLERIADFVTFIDRGKIIFSENKDDLLARYSVIQGPKGTLGLDLESRLLGLRRAAFGFEGLCSDGALIREELSVQCVIEKASLEQIMIFLVRENEKAMKGSLSCSD
jgi:ABC-2 type transport system ATP-binding protein